MSNPIYIMIGGFLGAGKTTTVARLARHYLEQGRQVGIVTNDQTDNLVDTHSLRAQGFDVGEVAGSCFCCNFHALTDTVEKLGPSSRPDVILAEPVGSCTDLVATVIRPLSELYDQPLDVAPYGVILKPSHGLRILRDPEATTPRRSGFSPQAEYIFRKQLEEADFVLINKIDELEPAELDELKQLVTDEFPGRPVIGISARTGEGFPSFLELLERARESQPRAMEVDYDVYAAGEAELGWLNCQVGVHSPTEFSLDTLVLDVVSRLQRQLVARQSESAHVKAIGLADGDYAVANLVSNESDPELSLRSDKTTATADLVVNARVATDPADLELIVREVIAEAVAACGANCDVRNLQSFRPGRPVPTHRLVD